MRTTAVLIFSFAMALQSVASAFGEHMPEEEPPIGQHETESGYWDSIEPRTRSWVVYYKKPSAASEGVMLSDEGRAKLDDALDVMRSAATIRMTGHADATGDREGNLEISVKAAEAAAHYCVEHGISESKISVIGMGAERLSNELNPSDPQNNRIEIEAN